MSSTVPIRPYSFRLHIAQPRKSRHGARCISIVLASFTDTCVLSCSWYLSFSLRLLLALVDQHAVTAGRPSLGHLGRLLRVDFPAGGDLPCQPNQLRTASSMGRQPEVAHSKSGRAASYASSDTEKGGPPSRSPSEGGQQPAGELTENVRTSDPRTASPIGNARQISRPPGRMTSP